MPACGCRETRVDLCDKCWEQLIRLGWMDYFD